MKSTIESYLDRLRAELQRCGLPVLRILDETRGHLTDATEAGVGRGSSREAAEHEAIAQFGSPEMVASTFASERFRVRNGWLLAVSVILGIAIVYVDSRPTWDDAGITAGALFVSAAVLGLLGPQRPWLWALGVGVWIPAYAIIRSPSLRSLEMLAVLAFPFAGAYAAWALRRVLDSDDSALRRQSFHFALKTRKGWADPQLLAIGADPESLLAPYLERVAPRPLGPLGKLESLTLLEESSRVRRYRAVFGGDVKVVCTIVLAAGGRAASIDWNRSTD